MKSSFHRPFVRRRDFGSIFVVALVACMIATLWIFVTSNVHRLQDLDDANSRTDAQQIAALLEGGLSRSFDVAVATLDRAADAVGRADQIEHFQKVLRDIQWSHPEITSVAIVRPDGRGNVATVAAVRDYDGGSTETLTHHARARSREIFLSLPFEGSSSGMRRIAVSRRLDGASGEFAGFVAVTVRYEFVEEMLAAARQGPNGTVNLFRADKIFMARSPDREGLAGRSGASAELWRHYPANEAGAYTVAASTLDGASRIVAFHKVANHPLIVAATLDASDLEARKAEIARIPYRSATGATLALAGIGVVGVIAMRRLHRMRQAAEIERVMAEIERSAAETARANAQREYQRAELASRAKTRFLANMSHELRTPLNAVIGFAETVKGGYVEPCGPRTREYATHILESGRHLLSLVDDLLDLAQFEIAPRKLDLELLDVREVVDTAVSRMALQYAQRRVALDVTGTAESPVALNRRALVQIMLNLLSNALRFTPVGGRVEVAIRRVGQAVEIAVGDDGSGMPADMIARIGEPFIQNTDHMTARKSGSGLGLAIVKALTEQQNGTLSVHAKPDGGTVFAMRFAPSDGSGDGTPVTGGPAAPTKIAS